MGARYINKNILFFVFVLIGMLVLLYLMTYTFWEIRQAVIKVIDPRIPLIKMTLWGFLFGIFIEWKALKRIIKGHMKVKWLLIPTMLLMILSFIPGLYWSMWFGNGMPFYIQVFSIPETHMLLSAFSGILLVRSFDNNKTDVS